MQVTRHEMLLVHQIPQNLSSTVMLSLSSFLSFVGICFDSKVVCVCKKKKRKKKRKKRDKRKGKEGLVDCSLLGMRVFDRLQSEAKQGREAGDLGPQPGVVCLYRRTPPLAGSLGLVVRNMIYSL